MRKLIKWMASFVRVCICIFANGGRLKIDKGKPLYLAKGVRITIEPNATCHLGAGVYFSRNCSIDVSDSAHLIIGDNVFLNENSRIVCRDSISVGNDTLFGPNVSIYDHDHLFCTEGVLLEYKTAPVHIGQRCWIGANSVVTSGVKIPDASIIGALAAVTRSLETSGVWGGAPARLIRAFEKENQ